MLSRRTLLQSAAMASVAMPYLARTASAQDAWPSARDPFDLRFPAGLRRRRVRALLRQEARGQARQDHHHREQGRRVRQHRDRIRREIQARRLHAVHRAGQFVPCGGAELVQEVGFRSGQRLRTRDDALQAAVHSGGGWRQPLQIGRRPHRLSQAAGRQGVLRIGRQHRHRQQRTLQGATSGSTPSR